MKLYNLDQVIRLDILIYSAWQGFKLYLPSSGQGIKQAFSCDLFVPYKNVHSHNCQQSYGGVFGDYFGISFLFSS